MTDFSELIGKGPLKALLGDARSRPMSDYSRKERIAIGKALSQCEVTRDAALHQDGIKELCPELNLLNVTLMKAIDPRSLNLVANLFLEPEDWSSPAGVDAQSAGGMMENFLEEGWTIIDRAKVHPDAHIRELAKAMEETIQSTLQRRAARLPDR